MPQGRLILMIHYTKVTVKDSSHCHMLANKHPEAMTSVSSAGAEVELIGAMDGAGEAQWGLSPSRSLPFRIASIPSAWPTGSRCLSPAEADCRRLSPAVRGPPPGESPRLRLTVRHASDSTQLVRGAQRSSREGIAQATVMVDLHRSGAKSVPLWCGALGRGVGGAAEVRRLWELLERCLAAGCGQRLPVYGPHLRTEASLT